MVKSQAHCSQQQLGVQWGEKEEEIRRMCSYCILCMKLMKYNIIILIYKGLRARVGYITEIFFSYFEKNHSMLTPVKLIIIMAFGID